MQNGGFVGSGGDDDDQEETSSEYHSLLEEAKNTDLTDLEGSGCVSLCLDNPNYPFVIFLPKLGFMIPYNQAIASSSTSFTNGGSGGSTNFTSEDDRNTNLLKRMMLLFIKKAHDVVHNNYDIVYGHTPMSLLSQHPIIYQYYKILPRPYKKNLKNLFILHPQLGIKLFFEFARVFLSHKFYSKLVLMDNIIDLQNRLPSMIHALPLKFMKLEDEERGLKYKGPIPSLTSTFISPLGTTKLLADCTHYIRTNNGFHRQGLFRIAGDEELLNMAKIRMQVSSSCQGGDIYSNTIRETFTSAGHHHHPDTGDTSGSGISAIGTAGFIVHDRIVIGKGNNSSNENKRNSAPGKAFDSDMKTKHGIKKTFSDTLSGRNRRKSILATLTTPPDFHFSGINNSSSSDSNQKELPNASATDSQISKVSFKDIDSVAQILKFSLRELPEPLITTEAYQSLMTITSRLRSTGNNDEYTTSKWSEDVMTIINSMPIEHKSTLNHLLYFLAEVASYSRINSMDSSNLGMIFAPTVTRSSAEDHGQMLAEMGYSKTVMIFLINNFASHFQPIVLPSDFLDSFSHDSSSSSSHSSVPIGVGVSGQSSRQEMEAAVEQLQQGLSSAMLDRMNKSSRSSTRLTGSRGARPPPPPPPPDDEEEEARHHHHQEDNISNRSNDIEGIETSLSGAMKERMKFQNFSRGGHEHRVNTDNIPADDIIDISDIDILTPNEKT